MAEPSHQIAAGQTPDKAYQRRLLVFLSVATFFEGYDFLALSQVLPNLRRAFALSESAGGALFAVVNFGTMLAFFLVRMADRWGRKRVLTVTIIGYTVLTFLSGLSPNVFVFAGLQMLARVFLLAEYSTSLVIAAEEFSAERRGFLVGVIAGMAALGAIVCAGVAPMLIATQWGWRTVYLISVVPLMLLAWARRGLRETRRFATVGQQPGTESFPWFRLWRSPYRGRMLRIAALWFVCYIPASNAVAFIKEYAVSDLGWDDGQVGKAVVIAAVGSLPLVFLTGKLLDHFGRRKGGVLIFALGAVGISGAYQATTLTTLTIALVFGMYAATAFLQVMNTVTAELFPTELRADAFAWCNNVLGRTGYVLSPLAVGFVAQRWGWGVAVAPTGLLFLVGIVLLLRFVPETAKQELEQSARLSR